MGIKGLTNFIQRNSFMEKHSLHNTNIVVEGGSVLRQLFMIHSSRKSTCFGGDYDKFADYIDEFFEMLDSCKVIPYVVFEGGVEKRRMKNKLKKISNRLDIVKNIDDILQENSEYTNYIPLYIREVFESIVVKRKIKTIRCDFESYTATLSIAKHLNCPILSYDSDYFMCSGVTYIPFHSLCNSKEYPQIIPQIRKDVKFISCEIFKVNEFLRSLRLTFDKLPLLSTMLGNNYIDTTEFPKFHLWPERASFQSRITKIASWISGRSVETAVEEILKLASGAERASLKLKIQQSMNGYECYKSKYLFDLGMISNPKQPENSVEIENNKLIRGIPKIFLENFRKCRYSADLMDIFIHNSYMYLKPQVEIMNSPHSHIFSERIVSAIQKMLTNSQIELSCPVTEGGRIIQKKIPLCNIDVPSFSEVQEMDIEDRRNVLLEILGLHFLKEDTLQAFPESWQLFIVVILYLRKLSSLTWPLCYSLVLCKTILQEVDGKKGRLIRCCEKKERRSEHDKETTQILYEMDNFIEYFHMRDELRRNSELFDINLVHGMSQFQSCLFHIILLNDLLNMPLPDFLICDCFNGTFIYNISKLLENQSNIHDFVKISMFQNSPRITANFNPIIDRIRKIDSENIKG